MAKIGGYLTFDGNCREAMGFYKGCFGGELALMTVAQTPMADQMKEMSDKIMHASLTNGNLELMASDMCMEQAYIQGNNVSLMVTCTTEDEINRFYKALSPSGKLNCELGVQFWGDTFASVTDKYGITWNMVLPQNR